MFCLKSFGVAVQLSNASGGQVQPPANHKVNARWAMQFEALWMAFTWSSWGLLVPRTVGDCCALSVPGAFSGFVFTGKTPAALPGQMIASFISTGLTNRFRNHFFRSTVIEI